MALPLIQTGPGGTYTTRYVPRGKRLLALDDAEAGDEFSLEILRDQDNQDISVTLEESDMGFGEFFGEGDGPNIFRFRGEGNNPGVFELDGNRMHGRSPRVLFREGGDAMHRLHELRERHQDGNSDEMKELRELIEELRKEVEELKKG